MGKEKKEKRDNRQQGSYEDAIIEHLQACNNTAPQEQVLAKVRGKRQNLLEAIKHLSEDVVTVTGVAHSPKNPLILTLNTERLPIYYMSRGNLGKASQTANTSQAALEMVGFSGDFNRKGDNG